MERKIPSFAQRTSKSDHETFSFEKQLLKAFVSCQPGRLDISNKTSIALGFTDEEIRHYSCYSLEEKIVFELKSLGLQPTNDNNTFHTPYEFVTFLYNLVDQQFDDYTNLLTYIKDNSILFKCPFSCIDSNVNRRNVNVHYLKFVCKLHTKRLCNCNCNFVVYVNNHKIISINFINRYHNHPLDELFIGSKVSLVTSREKKEMKCAARKGLPSNLIRKFYGSDLLPNQLYNIIRKEKRTFFEDEIHKLYEYVQTLKNDFDFIWKEDSDDKFHSLLLVNSRINNCAYSSDIVMVDDTCCTNQFQYPILGFIVLDENNKVQVLGIGIITAKEEINFVDIFESLKEMNSNIRVFIVDRLKAQINALQIVYPEAFLVFCRVHIYRNIEHKMGRKHEVAELFWKFIQRKMNEFEYVLSLQEIIEKTNSKHVKNLLNDLNHYSPYSLKKHRLRGQHSTNAIEGLFGNIKKWTDNKLHPIHEIIHMFVNQARIAMKNHLNIKFDQLDSNIYCGRNLGEYAVNKIKKRYNKILQITANQLNEESNDYLGVCQCNKDDLPCVHLLYKKLSKKSSDALLKEEDIPDIYFYQNLEKVTPKTNKVMKANTIHDEKWDYNSIMNKLSYWADLAQRSDKVRDLFRSFYEKAEEIKRSIDPMAKNVMVTSRSQPTVPSSTVSKYSFKKKRKIHCSICHQIGHNKKKCKLSK